MKALLLAACLLIVLVHVAVSASSVGLNSTTGNSLNILSNSTQRILNSTTETPKVVGAKKQNVILDKYIRSTTSKSILDDALLVGNAKAFLSPKEVLLQEIHTLDKEASNTKIQDEVARTFKAEAQKFGPSYTTKPTATKTDKNSAVEDSTVKKILDIDDTLYEDDFSVGEEDNSNARYGKNEEEGENDDFQNDKDDDEEEDDLEDEEQELTQCPDYCTCAGEYATASTATCNKFEEQSFGTRIAHLHIENAGQIRLGPQAFRSRGLQQLETITITGTKIVELSPSAFDGVSYLFSVNLTQNGLTDIPSNIFQNNTRLNSLAITGNSLKHIQYSRSGKQSLLDAPSVTELDLSFNDLIKLKHTAFSKMPSLVYINLKGNKLKELDYATFDMMDSLLEIDLSENLLNEIPAELLHNKDVETLRIAGNNLTTLSTIRMSNLRTLDASNNRIKIIAKDDLISMPYLDKLTISSNGLKRIHQHAFAGLGELTVLDISGNKLGSLTEHHLRTNTRLQVLLMNDNPGLETLPVFKAADVDYGFFSIYRFECSNCGLSDLDERTFRYMTAVTRLNLSKNRLTRLPNGLLSALYLSLRVLDLSDNIISSLDNDMFRGLTSLTKLSLAGNPLVTLQVSPFLGAASLTRLDVSRCELERVWSEARVPLTSLRYLSVRENKLQRITVEELKATPKLVSLDMSRNPFDCDYEFNAAIQWLTDHGVAPYETSRYISNYGTGDAYQDSDGISQWTDFAKVFCDGINDGPPDRTFPHKDKKLKIALGLDTSEDSDPLLRNDLESDEELLKLQTMDHGVKWNEEIEKAWTTQDQEYEDFVVRESIEYHPWYTNALWPVMIVIVITLMVLLLTAHVAVYLAKRRGRGPVIRPPMILRQGLIDNKNCGLVYKPLQEEIATPHVPKRGSFYSSSTFHYDKIVPESV